MSDLGIFQASVAAMETANNDGSMAIHGTLSFNRVIV